MEEQLISFETAKLAKEKGFINGSDYYFEEYIEDHCTNSIYIGYIFYNKGQIELLGINTEEESPIYNNEENKFNNYSKKYEAPTQSLLQKWLREKHNCIVEVLYCYENNNKIYWKCNVDYYKLDFSGASNNAIDFVSNYYETYEKALEIGLQGALKLIKNCQHDKE